uniref:Vacuolar protein-sorting-associated protein 36 n=1 Tax=Lepeophtheirus salmonis TaxID=72036 RepID=D3PFU3_LEPSM|nr:Vacuolar protein-sorting-associated protein 36 [Lepeophtheirus salmonis]
MNRFYPGSDNPHPGEFFLGEQDGVYLYQGHDKTRFKNGILKLTSHRLIWGEENLSLDLGSIMLTKDEEAGTFSLRSSKIALHLLPATRSSPLSNEFNEKEDFVRLSFHSGGMKSFYSKLTDALAQQQWLIRSSSANPSRKVLPVKKIRSGISGIERSIATRAKERNSTISQAFQDLDQLMEMAKPMVALSKSISSKIREKKGNITEDETIQFKSYLLSLGISDPVTRESHGSGEKYHLQLAKEIFTILESPMKDAGGTITLTDAFCRVNRARGMELLSPEDLLNACKVMKQAGVPLILKTFDSGLSVLVNNENTEDIQKDTLSLVKENTCLTPDELSRLIALSVVLSRERLFSAEKAGLLCRDDSVEGLKFYPNRFLFDE